MWSGVLVLKFKKRIAVNSIKDTYVKSLQDHQDRGLIQASTWSFRTIRDLRSLREHSDVLTRRDRAKIFFRGIGATIAWLPINLFAIPYTFTLASNRKNKPAAMPQLHKITPYLYLGTEQAAKSRRILNENKITQVLTILDHNIDVPKDQVKKHKWIAMEDYPHVDIRPAVKEALEFVRKARAKGQTVLIHCQMGMSRSASVAVAVVKALENMSPDNAIKYVKKKRPIIDLNYGFKKQILRS
jgi:protein-tyrosine phosphatase